MRGPHSTRTKIRCSIANRGKHLSPTTEFKTGHVMSMETREKIRRSMLALKERHHNWKGGITEENYKIRDSAIYRDWRNKVYRRDSWICQRCYKHCKAGQIVAHHIIPFSKDVRARFLVKNGMTLHRSCHMALHNQARKFMTV